MSIYCCPICGHTLSKTEYERVLKIHDAQQRHLQHLEDQLKKQKAELKTRVADAASAAKRKEQSKTQRLVQGKEAQIQKLRQMINNLKKGSTPQTEGLEDEATLVRRLKREFPGDDIQHKGKGGDVLHVVRFKRQIAGTIIYECKRTPRIDSAHIRQAHRAKQENESEFCVLVTTGQRKGFSGLALISDVLVVAPLGVIALAGLLREHLNEMRKARITQQQRTIVANRLLEFITSPQFKNPIHETIRRSTELQAMLRQEAKDHLRVWNRRWEHYRNIEWRSSQVHENVQLVLRGDKPEVRALKVPPLQLPAPSEK